MQPRLRTRRLTLDGRLATALLPTEPHGRPEAHLYLGNGFPAESYRTFIDALSGALALSSLELRPLWPDSDRDALPGSWARYADDLIAFLEGTTTGPVFGIGHSMGATATIMAAARRPDLFQQIVAIEPASVDRRTALAARVVPEVVKRRLGPARLLFREPARWSSYQDGLAYFRRHRGFQRLSDEQLGEVFTGLARHDADGQVTLRFPRRWELHNLINPAYVGDALARTRVPVHVVRCRPSVFMTTGLFDHLRRRAPTVTVSTFGDYGHLMPLEAPSLLADHVIDSLGLGR